MNKIWGKLYIGAIAGTLMGIAGLQQVAAAPVDTFVNAKSGHTQFVVQFNEKIQPQIKLTLIHLVQKGDSVWSIGEKYGVSVNELLRINSLDINKALLVNQRLIVPVRPKSSVQNTGQKQVELYLFVNEKETAVSNKSNESKHAVTHVVQNGETMFSIARKYQISTEELVKANDLSEKNYILIGQTLRIPKVSYHIVQPGETLSQISRIFNVTVQQLVEANSIEMNDPIVPGQQIKIVR